MGAYLTRRFLLMVLTLFGMSVLIFVMLRLVPGNVADILVDSAGIADPKEKAKIIAERRRQGVSLFRKFVEAQEGARHG